MPINKINLLKNEISNLYEEFEECKIKYFDSKIKSNILNNYLSYQQKNKGLKNDFEEFAKLLYFQRSDLIKEKINNIDYENILEIFNLWFCEIRHICEVLPNDKEMFD